MYLTIDHINEAFQDLSQRIDAPQFICLYYTILPLILSFWSNILNQVLMLVDLTPKN